VASSWLFFTYGCQVPARHFGGKNTLNNLLEFFTLFSLPTKPRVSCVQNSLNKPSALIAAELIQCSEGRYGGMVIQSTYRGEFVLLWSTPCMRVSWFPPTTRQPPYILYNLCGADKTRLDEDINHFSVMWLHSPQQH
jgi:hypothetical protein